MGAHREFTHSERVSVSIGTNESEPAMKRENISEVSWKLLVKLHQIKPDEDSNTKFQDKVLSPAPGRSCLVSGPSSEDMCLGFELD